jgi:cytochrome bd-type quinol oxidase subunit 1
MFSTGQLIFAGLFAVVFIIVAILAYKKDLKIHTKNYKGVQWVALSFAVFIAILFLIKFLVKN